MISSKQVLVAGGQFIQQISVGNKAPIDILADAVAPNAFHDSGASFDKPKCHPRTRLKILEIIMRWIEEQGGDPQARKQFLWLNGAAGCGKSAIAQSTIESCIERGLRTASFFFNRSDSTRNHAGSLVATLAYQLYGAFPGTEVQTEILSVIQKDPLIFKKTLQQQFTACIIQPLMSHFSKEQSTHNRAPFLIVIDGLDECIDRTAQRTILTGLANSAGKSDLCLQIFIASRPEHAIKLSFSSKHLEDMHTGLSLDLANGYNADTDIRLYLFDRFAQIKDDFNNRTTGRKLDQGWPGDRVIETLVKKSSRQFVYAATVIRYVESPRHQPDHRLDVVLNLRPDNGDHPFAELDSLYATILQSALDIEKVLHVLSLYLMDLKENICFTVIEKLLWYSEGEVETLFYDMGALVQVYERNDQLYLRFLHASLREYLLDAARSKQFHIDMDQETIGHVIHALQYLALCCSRSFNVHSTIARTSFCILGRIRKGIGRRTSQFTFQLGLQQSVLSFPLHEFLEPHTSTRTYAQLLRQFVSPFLELLEVIVLNDPTSSYIRDYQLEVIRSAILRQLRPYFDDDRMASVLVLFYHAGSHYLVPILEPPDVRQPYWHSTPFYLVHGFNEWDTFSLSHIWHDSGSSFDSEFNAFHRFMRQLLHHPSPTTKGALGRVVPHEKAALFCFKELAKYVPLPLSPFGKEHVIPTLTDDAPEDDTYPKLYFNSANGGQWRFDCFTESEFDNDEQLCFVLLGYLIFLLPRCAKYAALVAACEDHGKMGYIDQPDGPFPVRRRLLRNEINNYLTPDRVEVLKPNLDRAKCKWWASVRSRLGLLSRKARNHRK